MKLSVRKFSRFVVLFFAMTSIITAKAQLTTDTSYTVQQLVQNVLLGPGITVSNITYTGFPRAIGKFISNNTGLGIDSGIVMTTGSVLANDSTFANRGPMGPNDIGSDGAWNQTIGTDSDLTVIAGTSTYDASILAFDFISASDSVKFRYVFGSEEYSDFVNTGFNDAFAFFLNGVSVSLAQTNIALIPSTTIPVTINNVNNGNTTFGPAPGPCMNCAYYVDNPAFDALNYAVVAPHDYIQYDGFTAVLTASYPVQCGETYHIKIAIADVGDHVYDSGVFLEAGSFSAGSVDLSTQISYGSSNDSTLYEGCGTACITIARAGNLSLSDTVQLTVGGTAQNGIDYTPLIPSQVIFAPGQDSITICVQATQDNIAEGLETLMLTSIDSGICVQTVNNLTLYMSDFSDITVNAGNDTSLCSSSPITINTLVNGGVMPYNYLWSTGATTPSITVSPTQTTSYIVTVTDGCGTPQGQDTVTVYLPTGVLSTAPTPDLVLCTGDMALLGVSPTGGSLPYTITWTTLNGPDQVPNPNATMNQFAPTGSGTFVVEVREGCGTTRFDTIDVSIHDCSVVPPNVFTPNGDGTNDNLVFTGLQNFPGSSLFIYNRWGNKIYESSDYQNDWNGSNVSDGVYYYILNQSDGKSLTGFVTILRGK